MRERRRWPRYRVHWSVRLFVDDANTIVMKTFDVSLHGLRLAVDDEVGASHLRPGERYRFEVHLPDSEARFVRVGEVRHITEGSVGFKCLEPLPELIVPPPGERRSDDAGPSAASRRQRLRQAVPSVLLMLKAALGTRGHR